MKRTLLLSFALTALFCLSSQAATPSEYDHHYKLNGAKTWMFKVQENRVNDTTGNDDFWEPRIRKDITQQLGAQGFIPSVTPDLLVSYHLDTTERMETRCEHTGRPGYLTFGGLSLLSWESGWHDTTLIRTPHIKATLVLEVTDARTNQLLWRGSDTQAIDLIKPDQSIEKSVGNLLKHFTHDLKE